MIRSLPAALALALVACGGTGKDSSATDSARGEVASTTDTGMAGMDHSKMPGMAANSGADSAMAGMDHSKMQGMAPATSDTKTTTGSMAGMDHSKMAGMAPSASNSKMATRSMAGMDHSKMPGMGATKTTNATKATGGSMAGMDHSNMPGMVAPTSRTTRSPGTSTAPAMDHANMPGMTAAPVPAPAPAGEVKLERLIAALLQDSLVRARIRADTALRRRWDQAAQRTLLPNTPE